MTILLNTTQHAMVYGSILLIPAKPVEVKETEDELKTLYPALKKAMNNGVLKVITKAEAKRAEKDLNTQTIEELKAYATSHDIDLTGVTKKDDILAVISKAKGQA